MAEVSICIPAYRAAGFIGQTLDSVLNQTHPEIRVLVSIDSNDDDTETICRGYSPPGGMRIWVQERNLGWAGNVNFLLDQVDTPYFALLPHDDLLEPDYIAALLEALKQSPDCVFAQSHMQQFGTNENLGVATELRGNLDERLLQFYLKGASGLPLRAVTDSGILKQGHRLRYNRHDSFAAEVLWGLEALCYGGGCVVPRPLYLKHTRPDSLIPGRKVWLPAKRLDALRIHSAQAKRVLIEHIENPQMRVLALMACDAWGRKFIETAKHFELENAPKHGEVLLPVLSQMPVEGDAAIDQAGIDSLLKDPRTGMIISRMRFADGLRLMHDGKMADAARLFGEAFELDRNSPQALLRQGHCLIKNKQFDDALEIADSGRSLFPKKGEFAFLGARAAFGLHRLDESRALAELALGYPQQRRSAEAFLAMIAKMQSAC